MKQLILGFLFLFSLATAQANEFGLGAVLGSPSAITGKYMMDQTAAFDMGLSFSLSDYVLVYGDYLYHFRHGFGRSNQFISQVTPYLGVGAVVVFTNKSRDEDDKFFGKNSGALGLGVRIPLGIEWRPSKPTLGVFFEIAPGLSAIPKTSMFFQWGIGARYYF